jgi:ATP/maltotriose-dependent transcriptional regulator MalT
VDRIAVAESPTAALLGREAELDGIVRWLDAIGDGAAPVLLLSGPAGIGKTTLSSAGIAAATARGYRVVSARPTEVETGLAFAGLVDVLGPLLDEPIPDLPAPQREALDAALLRVPAPSPPQPLGVSLATLHVLRATAERAPILVAIDDAPWLDEASARALEFAMRRLGTERVGFLVARRAATPDEPLPRWLATLPPDRLARVDVGPLSIDATGALLRDRLDLKLSRSVLVRLHAVSGGTPFYALELARDLRARGAWATPDALEVPSSLDGLIGARLAALDPAAEEVAVVAAALSQPSVPVLVAALGSDDVAVGLDRARATGVLETNGEAVRFAHPLLAAAAYGRADPARRRGVHARLADVVTEPEERARHLARSAAGPDATIAGALEEGARIAAVRGATEIAAELAEESARLTPPDEADARHRRHLIAAEHLIASGELHRADAVLRQVAAESPDGSLRADALTRRALVALYQSDVELAERLLREAMPMTAERDARRVSVHALLAGLGYLTWRGFRPAWRHMQAALRLSRVIGDAPLELQMLGHTGTWTFGLGRPWRHLMDEADALGVPLTAVPAIEHPDVQFARLLAREGDVTEARRRLGRLIDSARVTGDWTSLPRLLVSLGGVELEAGSWDEAEAIAQEAESGLLQTGEGAFYQDALVLRLNLAVVRGDVDRARALAVAVEAGSVGSFQPLVRTAAPLALAMLDLSLGDPAAAHARLERVASEPGLGRLLPIRAETVVALDAEALVALGRVGEARPRIDHVVRRARRRGPSTALAEALRAQALVRSAANDHDGAIDAAEEAVRIHSALRLPFRSARASFTLGEVRRRARQKGAAREAFQHALDGFTDVGAAIWVERTQTELGRVASRRPSGSSLTDTERRVAELAAAGETNREIAGALFMSVHTVEAHLTRIFRALGVHSRTELARVDLDEGPSANAASDDQGG